MINHNEHGTLCSRKLTRLSEGTTDFGIKDKAARAIGYRWTISQKVYTELDSEARSGYRIKDGQPREVIEVYTITTRDGRNYGASFNTVDVNTVEEAHAVIAKRTEAARKNNLKKFGG